MYSNPEYGFFALETFALSSSSIGAPPEAEAEILLLQGINPFPVYAWMDRGRCAVVAGERWIAAARIAGTPALFALIFPSEGSAIAAYQAAIRAVSR